MESSDQKLLDNLKLSSNRKEEIFQLDKFINRYQSDDQYDSEIYIEIFYILVESRLTCINDNHLDYLYLLKVLQSIRLLSRNKNIQKELYKENCLNCFETILEKVIQIKSNDKLNEMIDNIIIESISIIRRYFTNQIDDENIHREFFNKMINGNLIDHLIFLLGKDNIIIIKLLHLLLLSFAENKSVAQKFNVTYAVENMITGVKDKSKEIAKVMLDFLIVFVDNKDFRNLFMFLEGHLMLINKLKNYERLEKEIILKILYVIQIIYKIDETLGDVNSSIISILFSILSNKVNCDYQINKQILTIMSAFAVNDDLNILIRMTWLEGLIKLLIDHTFKLRENTEEEKSLIVINQTLIVRILRLIFSLEKNRKYFKQLFPTQLLGIFIDVGNYKHNLNLYSDFINELNNLTEEDLKDIFNKSDNITTNDFNNLCQNIGGYTIVELIGKGGFGLVYKVKIGNQYFAMKEIKLEEKEFKLLKGNTTTKNIEMVINEIEIWKDLDHPNIIKYYTSFMEKDRSNVYIIMELVEGVNLSEYVSNLKEKGGKTKEREIIKILIDIVCGLKYLHKEKGVLYRDVNPHNIMIDNNFNVRMGDFGLARKIRRENGENDLDYNLTNLNHSVSSAFVGSILYSSPEMIKNQIYTEKSDLWSLGCVLYEQLTLTTPFEGDNPLTVAKNIVELNYKKLNKNDFEHPVLVFLIEKCLQLEPEIRIDINDICSLLGPYLADKINLFKRTESELKTENESINEKIFKLETAFANNINLSVKDGFSENVTQFQEFNSKKNVNTTSQLNIPTKTDLFKQSNLKKISDPLTKILDMINKIMFLTNESNVSNPKEEKFTYINKFKRKIFSTNAINNTNTNNANLIKTEIMKLINFSKENINFETEDRDQALNVTGMKGEFFKSRITYELLYHYIEELLILNNYY